MKLLKYNIDDMLLVSYFLRFSIAIGFLSAVLDRFGGWSKEVSVWGNWDNFVEYTGILNPWLPQTIIPMIAIIVTVLEIVLSVLLIFGYRLNMTSKISGGLLLCFALAMMVFTGLKGVLDYSVFIASGGAFALAVLQQRKNESSKVD